MRTIDISNTISHAKPDVWRVFFFFLLMIKTWRLEHHNQVPPSSRPSRKMTNTLSLWTIHPTICLFRPSFQFHPLLSSTIHPVHSLPLSLIPQYSNPKLTTTNPLAPHNPPPPKRPPAQHSTQPTRPIPPTSNPPTPTSKPKYPINSTSPSNPRTHISSPKSREVTIAILHHRLHAPTQSLFPRKRGRNGDSGEGQSSSIARHR